MFALAIVLFAAFIQGGSYAWWVFVAAAMFDLAFIEQVGEAIAAARGHDIDDEPMINLKLRRDNR